MTALTKTPQRITAIFGKIDPAYQAQVIAKSGTLDPVELARAESKRYWAGNPGPRWNSAANSQKQMQEYASRVGVNWQDRWDTVQAALPGRIQEIADRTGLSRDMTVTALRRLKDQGRAHAVQVGGNHWVWVVTDDHS